MSINHNKERSFIIKATEDNITPSFCPVCEFIMKTSDDVMSYSEFECCHECKLKWAQARREIWSRGWRPDEEEIDAFIQQRKNIRSKFDII
jgi:hypothetical protein